MSALPKMVAAPLLSTGGTSIAVSANARVEAAQIRLIRDDNDRLRFVVERAAFSRRHHCSAVR